jgi:hypothetical protein
MQLALLRSRPQPAITRAELQTVLDEILAAERAEAARLQFIQDQRSAFSNYMHRRLAVGKGFFLGAWGLLKTAKEFSDLVNPFTAFSNALRSAWQARASEGETWLAAYNRQFSAEQHRKLVEALGFDPSSITREQLAEAYELACFIRRLRKGAERRGGRRVQRRRTVRNRTGSPTDRLHRRRRPGRSRCSIGKLSGQAHSPGQCLQTPGRGAETGKDQTRWQGERERDWGADG